VTNKKIAEYFHADPQPAELPMLANLDKRMDMQAKEQQEKERTKQGSLCMVRRLIASKIFDGRSGLLLCMRLLNEVMVLLRAMMESAPAFS